MRQNSQLKLVYLCMFRAQSPKIEFAKVKSQRLYPFLNYAEARIAVF